MDEDDTLPNLTNIDTMEKSSKGIPFKGGQEMHVSTLRAFIHMFSLASSHVVKHELIHWYVFLTFFSKLKSQSVVPRD
jgi:hypothetical protein